MIVSSDPVATFASAAGSFAALVHDIPADAWDGPGLGDWDLRSLVGHASRSLITVSTYLTQPAQREDISSPQEYYARVTPATLGLAPTGIVERGRRAGRDLGDDPASTVDGLLSRVLGELSGVGDPLITVIGGAGLASRIGVAEGHGETVLLALTGRAQLPPGFSIV